MEPLGAAESVDRVAAHCRAEQLVFAVLGDGASRFAGSSSAGVLVTAADHAAWRAHRWYQFLPAAPPGPDALLVAGDADREVVASARDHGVDDVTLLAVASGALLPGLRRSLQSHLDRTDPRVDGPVRRLLGIALTDLDTDLAEVRRALERTATAPGERDRADRAAAAVAVVADHAGWPVPSP